MGRAVFNGFRKLLCSSKLYITAVILFSCIYTGFGGINGYLMRQGQTVQAGELFVFGMDSWIPQLIITVAFLILVNDIPFGKSGAQLQLIRSSRSRWLSCCTMLRGFIDRKNSCRSITARTIGAAGGYRHSLSNRG